MPQIKPRQIYFIFGSKKYWRNTVAMD